MDGNVVPVGGNKVETSGPWFHRFVVIISILLIVLFQDKIINNLQSLGIESRLLILVIEIMSIIFFWGTLHKIFRLS